MDLRRTSPTAVVATTTLAVSLVALADPEVMQLLVRDAGELRAGQWWRLVTPVLVQPDGWGQLVFNLLGVLVVGTALQRRVSVVTWSLVYLAGGPGTVALYVLWHPDDVGGGSSAAVAALLGALVVLLVVDAPSGRLDRCARLYAVFFAVYLLALRDGGVGWSVAAGNASIVAVVVAERALAPSTVARASLVTVVLSGTAMTAGLDDHGVGILVGAAVATVLVLHRRRGRRPGTVG